MKKTLIALMAASSIAMAVSLEEVDFSRAGNAGYDTLGNNFTVALTLDVAELKAFLEQGQPTAWGTDIVKYICNGVATGVTANGGSSSGKINTSGLFARWGGTTNWNSVQWQGDTNLSDLNGGAEGTGWDAVASAGLVYSFGATSGTAVAFTLIGNDGAAIIDSYVVAGGLKSGSAGADALSFDDSVLSSYYYNEYMGGNEASLKALASTVATTAPIPEPTTATLSLLALAGLAARRRRK
jgi:MYXO-CTERM domain-containing protein